MRCGAPKWILNTQVSMSRWDRPVTWLRLNPSQVWASVTTIFGLMRPRTAGIRAGSVVPASSRPPISPSGRTSSSSCQLHTHRRPIGLDNAPCWVIVSDYSVDKWPSADLASLSSHPGVFAPGFAPAHSFSRVRENVRKAYRTKARRQRSALATLYQSKSPANAARTTSGNIAIWA
jgi:hypothetical protein